MAEIIDFKKHLKRKQEEELEEVKNQLEIELQKLDYSMTDELNKFVIFDTSNLGLPPYTQTDKKKDVVFLLRTVYNILVDLDEQHASIEIDNIITRLENNSY